MSPPSSQAPTPYREWVRLTTCGVALALALPLLTACATTAGGPATPETSTSSPSASPTPNATPSTTPSTTPSPTPTSPLTGQPGPTAAPVLVVKLDNTRNAQPHAGLSDADVVYIEEVEYGITRLAAVFSSAVPERIGPVRSARITDIDLLAQYESPAFAFSGVQRKMWPVIDKSPLIDISPNKAAEFYSRDSNRRAPYNYFLNGAEALADTVDASMSRSIGFTFSDDIPLGGLPATNARMDWSYASAEFTYDPASGLYDVSMNDVRADSEESPDGQQASTVIIQYVKQEPSAYFDKGGGNTPHAETIGQGRALVLRDGQYWKVRWSRPDAQSGTSFTTLAGSPLPFKPGQQWVVLLDKERKAKIEPQPSPTATASPSSSAPATATATRQSPQP